MFPPRPCLQRCPKCPGRLNSSLIAVAGDGPRRARVVFVGEAPGREENNKRRPFTGNTGQEFNDYYLGLAGLHRDEVYVTNTVKCYHADKPDAEIIDSCSKYHLAREIMEIDPEVVVLMGAVACSLVPELDVELHHGFPMEVTLFNRKRTVFVTFHPALGLHEGRMMLHLHNDFVRLGKYLKGNLGVPVDEYPDPEYRIISGGEVGDFFYGGMGEELAIDTEWEPNENKPWSLQFSQVPGTGYIIKADDRDGLDQFAHWINEWDPVVLLHNVMYDFDVLAAMGIEIPRRRVIGIDTMMEAYHLGDQPQSLKQLAWRLCGMQMVEYEELVIPYGRQYQYDFFARASKLEWPKPEPRIVDDEKGIRWYRPQGLGTKFKRAMTDLSKNPTINLSERWSNWSTEERAMVEERIGRFPKPSIAMVPEEESTRYAGRDPDATLRVWWQLRKRIRSFRRDNNVSISSAA